MGAAALDPHKVHACADRAGMTVSCIPRYAPGVYRQTAHRASEYIHNLDPFGSGSRRALEGGREVAAERLEAVVHGQLGVEVHVEQRLPHPGAVDARLELRPDPLLHVPLHGLLGFRAKVVVGPDPAADLSQRAVLWLSYYYHYRESYYATSRKETAQSAIEALRKEFDAARLSGDLLDLSLKLDRVMADKEKQDANE